MELKTARRSGGRSRKSDRQSKKSIDQLEWGIPYNTDNFVEPLSEEGVNKVHNATMQVLEEIGIEFLNEEARMYSLMLVVKLIETQTMSRWIDLGLRK